ncbi:MAG TPA: hypothetical protein VFW30_06015 [Bryocella sp.]|nr:hypothetical protein [Bryocella sp.]
MHPLGKTVVALLMFSSVQSLVAQTSSQLQTLNDHFVGTWVGTNHDYSVNPVTTSSVTITVTEDKRKHRLNMEYVYVEAGKLTETRYRRYIVVEPATSTVFINRKGQGKEHLAADGLDELLRNGYGDFTLRGTAWYRGDHHALVRNDYHLSPDTWSYEIYVSASGGPFVKTGDWTMKRTKIAP